ncbi:MAG: ABC transporter permease [Planctomycetes bacterium]|nr:ABC transporter permease [Planctomycetota bacterium]
MRPVLAIATLGAFVNEAVSGFGRFTMFAGLTLRNLVAHPAHSLRWRLLGPQLYAVGVLSIPVVAITGAFIGMILSLEGYYQFAAIGQQDRMGGIINVSVVKQIGPVLAAVMVAGRVGGALAAELGTMRVTEQLDAMRAMAADPVQHLVVPRVVACTLMTPLLTVYSNMLGSLGAWLVTVKVYGVSGEDYWFWTAQFVTWREPVGGLVKSVFFGLAIGLVACYKGFNCRPGAAGVGQAATASFVSSFMAIIMINLVLAQFINKLVQWAYPDLPSVFG